MTLHLIKLCVGIDSVEQLIEHRRRRGNESPCYIHTRNRPKRAAEILDGGGSLYWVIKGEILIRQRVLGILDHQDEAGQAFCTLHLDGTLVRTVPARFRPFQGWRYFVPEHAPPDRTGDDGEMPLEMVRELRSLGLL
ncbi:MAG TPA: DUF1489 domain-containing protein [Stellaceae bacterium]